TGPPHESTTARWASDRDKGPHRFLRPRWLDCPAGAMDRNRVDSVWRLVPRPPSTAILAGAPPLRSTAPAGWPSPTHGWYLRACEPTRWRVLVLSVPSVAGYDDTRRFKSVFFFEFRDCAKKHR